MATETDTLLLQIKADNAQILGKLSQTQKATEKTASNMTKAMAGFATVYSSAFAVKGVVDVITKFEKLNASLKTVTGSTKAADSAFNQIRKFASTTPFQLNEVVDSFIKMKALGLDPSEAALTSYGNTASAMGRSLNQMIEAVADASTGEFERLKEFGIKTKSEGDKVTFTFQNVSTKVGKNAKEIEGYLQGIGNVQFAGAMAEQADDLSVAISNMKDSFDQLILAIGDAGLTDAMIDIANGIKAITQSATEAVEPLQKFLDKITDIMPATILLKRVFKDDPINEISEEDAQAFIKNFESGNVSGAVESSSKDEKFKPSPVLRDENDPAFMEMQQQQLDQLKTFEDQKLEIERDAATRRFEELAAREIELQDFINHSRGSQLRNTDSFLKRMKDLETASAKTRIAVGAGMFKNLLAEGAKHNKKLFEINKAAGIANAVVSTAAGMMKAVEQLGPIAGPVAAAGIAAMGAAQIATISSQSFSGGGGGAASPAGSTATAPVTAGGGGGSDSAATTNISIQGVSSDATFSSQQVRELIGAINDEIDNGSIIKGISVG